MSTVTHGTSTEQFATGANQLPSRSAQASHLEHPTLDGDHPHRSELHLFHSCPEKQGIRSESHLLLRGSRVDLAGREDIFSSRPRPAHLRNRMPKADLQSGHAAPRVAKPQTVSEWPSATVFGACSSYTAVLGNSVAEMPRAMHCDAAARLRISACDSWGCSCCLAQAATIV